MVVKEPNPRCPDPSSLQKRISTKTESSEASKVFVKRKKSMIHGDKHMDRLRGKIPELSPRGSLNNYVREFFSDFPLANHFDLPGSQFIWYISGSFHVCACIS